MASNVSAVSGSVANDHQTLASRFHKPPYDPGQWVFPSPVLTLAFLCGPSRLVAKLKYWHTYTPPTLVYPQTRSYFKGQFTLGTVSKTYPKNRQVPRAPLPRAGVTVIGKASRAFSESVTPPSSLLRTHAPDLCPSYGLWFPSGHRSLQVAASPLLGQGPSRRYLCESFSTCLDLYPGGSCSALTRFFPQDYGLPRVRTGSAPCHNPYSDFRMGFVSRLQSFTHVQARRFARHPGRSYRSASRHQAAMAFTSTHISVRYLPEQWIC